jgi:thymidylate synthase (FAD)
VNIELLDHCASDLAVANAARVSLDKWHDEFIDEFNYAPGQSRDDQLIPFLMRGRHGSPFEHGYFQFRVEAPIFVFREWHRHRVGHSYNEMSGRYTEMEARFYDPIAEGDGFRAQVGKPGAYTFEPIPLTDSRSGIWYAEMAEAYHHAYDTYERFLRGGMAKEQARAVLPLGLYSKMIWSCNPRSLMHFLGLRTNPQAMKEIRDLATDAMAYFEDIMPVTAAAFESNGRVAP